MNKDCLIFCSCGAGIISDEKKSKLSEEFKALGIDVFELHDLCAFSVNDRSFFEEIESTYNQKLIVACYPRAIENMLCQNGITLTNFKVINFRESDTPEIIQQVNTLTSIKQSDSGYEIKKTKLNVPAWYPVIDESRCTLCGQCARFCVFGVYSFNKKSLNVANPLSCKNNCPACGRTCPASAIIFPRLPENSILSGAIPPEKNKPQTSAQNNNLFVMLNERNNNRRNIFRQGAFQQAEEEKRRALEELKRSLDNNKKDD